MKWLAAAAAAAAASLAIAGCSKGALVDFAMRSAPRPPEQAPARIRGYEVLAGDLHCHVLPPDSKWHASRGVHETVALAKAERLDFVVLTPHVPSRFFSRPDKRAWVRETQAALREQIAREDGSVLLVPGMEYTDPRYGHVGLAFAPLEQVLAEVSVDASADRPELFFERWSAHGGLATINHPMLRGIPGAPIRELRATLGWRALLEDPPPIPAEIAWLTENAPSIETLNTSVSHLRDQFARDDVDLTLRESAHLVDRLARAQHRRVTPVGGSDSHGDWLRGTTWVLARERSIGGVRDAILAGRTCVRGPAGCTLEARVPGGRSAGVGEAVATGPRRTVELRSRGGPAVYFLNGAVAARAESGASVAVSVPGSCALLRAVVGDSWSSPIYVDCPWAR